jgi:hypothetical protein
MVADDVGRERRVTPPVLLTANDVGDLLGVLASSRGD